MNAVEEALRIKEATGDGEVVLVSMGPARALEALRKALAMGADRALLVSDDAAAGSDLVATSYVLAAALERESADLVLFGQQASRLRRRRALGRRRRPAAAAARSRRSPSSTLDGGKVRVKRQTEFGYDVIEAPLPAVVAVSDAINEPRYPSLKGIMGAKSKPQETLVARRPRRRRRRAWARPARGPRCSTLAPPPARGESERSRTTAAPPRRSSTSSRRGSSSS